MEGLVVLTCASWFQDEEGNVNILNSFGNTVILNKLYSEVWIAIDGEIEISVLEERLSEKIQRKQLEEILHNLEERDLVTVRNDSDSFDILF